jgi:hypothetical protein
VRAWSVWSRTRAAATIFPICQGHRLTLRSALKVILSRALPRSAMARMPLWARLSCCCAREPAVLECLERPGDGVGFALVAQIAEGAEVTAGRGKSGQDLGVGAHRGGVVLTAGSYLRSPDRPAVRRGDDLDVAAVVGVLASTPVS